MFRRIIHASPFSLFLLLLSLALVLLAAAILCVSSHMQHRSPVPSRPAAEDGSTPPAAEYLETWTDTPHLSRSDAQAGRFLIHVKNTGDTALTYDLRADLQLLRDGVWYDLEWNLRPGQVIVANDQVLAPGETSDAAPMWSLYGQTVLPGHYRCVIRLHGPEDREGNYTWVEFDVVP